MQWQTIPPATVAADVLQTYKTMKAPGDDRRMAVATVTFVGLRSRPPLFDPKVNYERRVHVALRPLRICKSLALL